jgi:hypothetical protein
MMMTTPSSPQKNKHTRNKRKSQRRSDWTPGENGRIYQGNQRALKRRSNFFKVVVVEAFFFKGEEVIYRNVGASGVEAPRKERRRNQIMKRNAKKKNRKIF